MERNCPICKGLLVKSKVRVAIAGSSVGNFDGYKCLKCGEEYLMEQSIQSAHEEIVRAGLFGILRRTPAANLLPIIPFTISKAGTSGPSAMSQSGLIFAEKGTATTTVIEGHTPSC